VLGDCAAKVQVIRSKCERTGIEAMAHRDDPSR
jgi:hypothetical protein